MKKSIIANVRESSSGYEFITVYAVRRMNHNGRCEKPIYHLKKEDAEADVKTLEKSPNHYAKVWIEDVWVWC